MKGSIESILDNVTPEILGLFNDDKFLMPCEFNERPFELNRIVSQIYNYLPSKPIIEILHEIRLNENPIVYESVEVGLSNMIQNGDKIARVLEKINESTVKNFRKSKNKIKFSLLQKFDTIESIVFEDIFKIKNIKIMMDRYCVLSDSFNNLDYTQIKEYMKHNTNEIIKGLLLSNYNIPTISIQYSEIIIEIEFVDDYIINDEICIIHTLLDTNTYDILKCVSYELDTQPGKFVIFSQGMFGEHFTSDNGNLSKKYQNGKLDDKKKKLFDSAHNEANRRKTLNKNLNK